MGEGGIVLTSFQLFYYITRESPKRKQFYPFFPFSPNSISRGRSQGCNHQLRLDSKFKRLKKSGLSGCEKEKGRCSSQVFSSCRVIDSLM